MVFDEVEEVMTKKKTCNVAVKASTALHVKKIDDLKLS